MTGFLVTVPSHRRPETVERFIPGLDTVWVVNDGQDVRDYRAAGAETVVQSPDPWPGNRNYGIHLALMERCINVQVDDKVTGIDQLTASGVESVSLPNVARTVYAAMAAHETPFGGINMLSPSFFPESRLSRPLSLRAFVQGAFMMIDPRLPERFTLECNEDWEMNCKVIDRVNRLVRLNLYSPVLRYPLKKRGGLSERRRGNPGLERETARQLLRQYPHIVRLNSRSGGKNQTLRMVPGRLY